MSGALKTARARACANIALAKYWGKSDTELNLPAVPSISVTLDALVTETAVTVDPAFTADRVALDGRPAKGEEATRVTEILSRLRQLAGTSAFAQVDSANQFPTASGLASSASGFAALVAAASRAYGLDLSLEALSAMARRGSASAARSLFGGFVELPAGVAGDDSLSARTIAPSEHWDIVIVIALATHAPKKVGSRDGMLETARTSPYYPAWLSIAPIYTHAIREGIHARDLVRVGEAMEASTFAMHASALAARPAVRYSSAATMQLLDVVTSLRASGCQAYSTMDAGPHVKVLAHAHDADRVAQALRNSGAAVDVRIARPGPSVEWLS